VPASQKALARAGLKIGAIGLCELNEAFAAQSIPCVEQLELDPEIVNVNGGAIALGHPLGASGARLVITLMHELALRPKVRYGLATMCVGVGQGMSVILERV
jgi:acetyl-CoA C-acetyltransferase